MVEIEWLLFIPQLPSTPSSLRVYTWRKLRSAGAVSLNNSVWILPRKPECRGVIEQILRYLKKKGASGQVFFVQDVAPISHKNIMTMFEVDRNQEYDEFLEQCDAFLAELGKESAQGKFTFAELEENEHNLKRLEKWITRIEKRDFFSASKAQQAQAALQYCRENLKNFTQQVYRQEGIDFTPGSLLAPENTNLSEQTWQDEAQDEKQAD
jgi:hypothetical protein